MPKMANCQNEKRQKMIELNIMEGEEKMSGKKNFFLGFVEENSKLIFNDKEKKELIRVFKELYEASEIYYKTNKKEYLEDLDGRIDNAELYVNKRELLLFYWLELDNGETVLLRSDEVDYFSDMDSVKKYKVSNRERKIICGNYYFKGIVDDKSEKIISQKILHISKQYNSNNKVEKDFFLKQLDINAINNIFIFENKKDKFELEYDDLSKKYIITKIKKFKVTELSKYIDKVVTLSSNNQELIDNIKKIIPAIRKMNFNELSNEVYLRFLYGAVFNNYKDKKITVEKIIQSHAKRKIEEIINEF